MSAAAYTAAIGAPVGAFIGSSLGTFFTRRGDKELEKRSKREETMRNLRWAAELAVHEDDRKAQLGVAQLNALDASDLLDERQQMFIDAALDAVVSVPLEELDELGDDAFAVETDIAMTDDLRRVIESERRRRERGGDLG